MAAEKRVFISWAGKEALKIGEWLKKTISDLPGCCAFISSEDIGGGRDFFNEIDRELKAADVGVAIMTDTALDRPWLLYEIAALKAQGKDAALLRFGDPVQAGHPLYFLNHTRALDFEEIYSLLISFLDNHKVEAMLRKDKSRLKKEWQVLIGPIVAKNEKTSNLRRASATAINAIHEYKASDRSAFHSGMQELARKTLDDLAVAFRGLLDDKLQSFVIDYRRYPDFLVHLQRELNAKTYAIAVVDDLEEFWAQKTGQEILKTTNPESQRIFVFEDEVHLRHHFPTLLLHAARYPVYVMSAGQFNRVRDRLAGDFALIVDPKTGDRITAFYDNAAVKVEFSIDRVVTEQKLSVFRQVLSWAKHIDASRGIDPESYVSEIENDLFRTEPLGGQHSSVIPIEQYDAFEEDHPYYREMHECMLDEFRKRVDDPQDSFQVLEIGAGTGLLTKKVAQQPFLGMKIQAMEPDTEAQPLLLRKLQSKANLVKIIQASILNYDPRGEFRFVFSSFSEHHIRPEDKDRYFAVVKGTMEPGGFLIIGDEFLPMSKTEAEDPAGYDYALEKYHTYIIDLALSQHHTQVAELERFAMESGRRNANTRIDFKVGLNWYKERALAAGFELVAEHRITPALVEAEVGGIYVLVMKAPLSAK